MASVNTNAAAITALRTLQNTNASLDKTQSRISTGYKIGEAKDNAAYWAISTTLKSDNKSLSTVKDALGLGSSTVDVAYQGLNKAKDVLDEIKSKLTAATQDGVDRNTIQDEIKQLQDQLKSIATSSVFSGENWLSVNTSAVSYNENKSVVASFSRDASGSVAIGTIGVDISNVALFDASTSATAGGIVDGLSDLKTSSGRDLKIGGTATTGNTNAAGVAATATAGVSRTVSGVAATAADGQTATATAEVSSNAAKASTTLGTFANTSLAIGDKINVAFKVDGGDIKTVSVAITAGMMNATAATAATAFQGALNTALTGYGVTSAGTSPALTLESDTVGAPGALSKIQLMSLSVTGANGKAKYTQTEAFGGTTINDKAASYITASAISGTNFAVTDKISFDFTVNGDKLSVTVPASKDGVTAVSIDTIVDSLNSNGQFSAKATASKDTAGKLVITSTVVGASSHAVLNSVSFTDKDNKLKTVASTGFANVASAASFTAGVFQAVTLDDNDNITFDVQTNSAKAATTVSVTKELVDKTLGDTANGSISTAADYAKVLNAALAAKGIKDVTATAVAGAGSTQVMTFTSTVATPDSLVKISNLDASGGANQISVDKIDISDKAFASFTSDEIKQVLSAYIDVVNSAINKVTDAAASLGSVASRIDMQKSFVDTLMDTIDKGVGTLIDADMSEESTKLQALQVKQQLGTQSLSIANQAAQNILSLFRS